MSLSKRLAGGEVGELVRVIAEMGSFPFVDRGWVARGGEEEEMKMGREPLEISPIGIGEGDRMAGSSVGSGIVAHGWKDERDCGRLTQARSDPTGDKVGCPSEGHGDKDGG